MRLRWMLPSVTLLSVLGAKTALAQTTPTVAFGTTPPVVTRVTSDGSPYGCPQRNSQAQSCIVDGTSQGIGYHDCLADTSLRFSLTMTNVPDPNYDLQIWAGTTDCTQPGATGNSTTGTCWPVATPPQMLITISPLDIRVADIVSGLGKSAGNMPTQYTPGISAVTACGTARTATAGYTTQVTDDAGNTTTTAGVSTVTVFFMVFATGANSTAPISNVSYPVKVKLVGPNAVTGLTANTGDGEIILDWTPPTGDLTVQGFDLFAVPEGTTLGDGGTQTVCDAGAQLLDDAGNPVFDDAGNPVMQDAGCTTTSTSSTATCNGTSGNVDVSSITCPSGGADAGSAAICQVTSSSTTASGTISGLTNGTNYVATVTAFDQYGNAGAAAQAVCEAPAPIDNFWKVYNQEGGNAFCALEVIGKRGGSVAAALMSLVGLVWMRRRRSAARRTERR